MMVKNCKKCVICGKSQHNDPKCSLFGLPKTPERKDQWIKRFVAKGVDSSKIKKSSRVCDVHFSKDQIVNLRLIPKAMPNAEPDEDKENCPLAKSETPLRGTSAGHSATKTNPVSVNRSFHFETPQTSNSAGHSNSTTSALSTCSNRPKSHIPVKLVNPNETPRRTPILIPKAPPRLALFPIVFNQSLTSTPLVKYQMLETSGRQNSSFKSETLQGGTPARHSDLLRNLKKQNQRLQKKLKDFKQQSFISKGLEECHKKSPISFSLFYV